MPISSSDTANIIQGQQNMFSASAQYARMLSSGDAGPPPGVPPMSDARDRSTQMMESASIANAASRAPAFAAGGVAMAAAFGQAPRMFDPFTASAHSASQGFASHGMAGAVGRGAMTLGALGGAGMMANSMGFQPFQQGAQGRAALNTQMGGMFGGANMNQLGQMSQAVEAANQSGAGTLGELTSLINQGVSQGDISTTNISKFQASFQKLVSTARQIATTLNSTITEGNAALQTVRGLGVSSDAAPGVISQMSAMGRASGQSPTQMLGAAARGAQMGEALGMAPGAGISGAMVQQATGALAMQQGGISGLNERSMGRMQQGAMNFLGSRFGGKVLAASFDPSTGGLDQGVAGQIAAGTMGAAQIRQRAAQTMASHRDDFRSRRGELAGQFISEHGPQGISAPLQARAAGTANPQMLMQQITGGMGRRDIEMMNQMAAQTPMLRQELMSAAKAGFQEGQQQNMGLAQGISQGIKQLTAPIRQKFKEMGASMTQTVMSAMQDVTREFAGSPPPAADPALFSQMANASITGDVQAMRGLQGALGSRGGGRFGPVPNQSQFSRSSIPPALRMGSFSPGTSALDFPQGGMSTQQYNPAYTGIAAASGAGALARIGTGRNVLGGLAAAPFSGAGNFAAKLAGGSQSGFMGMGGRGPIGGMAMAGARTLQGVGGLLRGAGRVLGNPLVGAGLVAADALLNSGPALRRDSGQDPTTSGAVTGTNARLVEMLGQAGVMKIQGFKQGQGMTPILPQGGVSGAGQQGFMMSEFEKGDAFLGTVPDQSLIDKVGGQSSISQEVQTMSSQGYGPEDQMELLAKRHGIKKKEALQIINKEGVIATFTKFGSSNKDPAAMREATANKLMGIVKSGKKFIMGIELPGRDYVGGSPTSDAMERASSLLKGPKGEAYSKIAFGLEISANKLGSGDEASIQRRQAEVTTKMKASGMLKGLDPSASAALTRGLATGLLGATREQASQALGVDTSGWEQSRVERTLIQKGMSNKLGVNTGEAGGVQMGQEGARAYEDLQSNLTGSSERGARSIQDAGFLTGTRLSSLGDMASSLGERGGSGIDGAKKFANIGEMRGDIVRQLEAGGATDQDTLHQIASTLSGSDNAVANETGMIAGRMGRVRGQIKRRGRNAEGLIEDIAGKNLGSLGAVEKRILSGKRRKSDPVHTAKLDAFLRSAATEHLATTQGQAAANDAGAVARSMATFLELGEGAASNDVAKAQNASNQLVTYGQPPNPVANQRGGMAAQGAEFTQVVNDVVKGLKVLRGEITQSSVD